MNKTTLALAQRLGVDFEEDDSGLWAYAPVGFHFKASGTATLTQGYVRGQFKTEADRDIRADLRDGIEACDEEYCSEAGHWGREHPNAPKGGHYLWSYEHSCGGDDCSTACGVNEIPAYCGRCNKRLADADLMVSEMTAEYVHLDEPCPAAAS